MSETCPKCGFVGEVANYATFRAHPPTPTSSPFGRVEPVPVHIVGSPACLRAQLAQRSRCGACGIALTLNESGSPLPCDTCMGMVRQEAGEASEEEIKRLREALRSIAAERAPDPEKSHEARVLINCIRNAAAELARADAGEGESDGK